MKNIRISSGAVVYRFTGEASNIEILLVKSTNKGAWVFPKGGVEPGMTKRQNAVKEVWEEAGVLGILGDRVSRYKYTRAGVQQRVTVFRMLHAHTLEDYPEAGMRERKWFPVQEAYEVLNQQLQGVLSDFLEADDETENDE